MCSPESVSDSVGGISAFKLVGHAVVFHHVGHHIIRVAVPAHHSLPVCLLGSHTTRHEINMVRHDFILCVMTYIHGDMEYANLDMKRVPCVMTWHDGDMKYAPCVMKFTNCVIKARAGVLTLWCSMLFSAICAHMLKPVLCSPNKNPAYIVRFVPGCAGL